MRNIITVFVLLGINIIPGLLVKHSTDYRDSDIQLADTLIGHNEYLVFPDSLVYYDGYRSRLKEVLENTHCDTLIGRNEFFVYLLHTNCVIGIKEEGLCRLLCFESCELKKSYLIPLDGSGLEYFFKPLPVRQAYVKDDYFVWYWYYIHFNPEGKYDLEFDVSIVLNETQKTSKETRILEKERGCLNEIILLNALVLDKSEAKLIEELNNHNLRVEWWNGYFNCFGIITDTCKGVSDTLVWHRNKETQKEDMHFIVGDNNIIIPDRTWIYHIGPSTIVKSADFDNELSTGNSVVFRRRRCLRKERISLRIETNTKN